MNEHSNDQDKKGAPEGAPESPKAAKGKEVVAAKIERIIDQSKGKVTDQLDKYTDGSMEEDEDESGGSMGAQMERDYALQQEAALNRLTKIGPDRPIGFVPLTQLSQLNIHGDAYSQLMKECRTKGFETRIFRGENWPGWQEGSLYVYDKSSLQKILDGNKKILEDAKWPLEADQFVRNLNVLPKKGSPMDELLSRIFGKDNREPLVIP